MFWVKTTIVLSDNLRQLPDGLQCLEFINSYALLFSNLSTTSHDMAHSVYIYLLIVIVTCVHEKFTYM